VTIEHTDSPEVRMEFELETESRWRHLLSALRAAARDELHFTWPRHRRA
jgi:hypothetical protein